MVSQAMAVCVPATKRQVNPSNKSQRLVDHHQLLMVGPEKNSGRKVLRVAKELHKTKKFKPLIVHNIIIYVTSQRDCHRPTYHNVLVLEGGLSKCTSQINSQRHLFVDLDEHLHSLAL